MATRADTRVAEVAALAHLAGYERVALGDLIEVEPGFDHIGALCGFVLTVVHVAHPFTGDHT